MDDRFWKIVVRLGVPGLALGVFFALLNKFDFQLAPVPPEWAGPLAIFFLAAVTIVVIVALLKYRHTATTPTEPEEPTVRKGYRRFKVQIVAPDGLKTIEHAELPVTVPWSQATCGFVVGFNLPQEPSLYRLLDVKNGKWLSAPRTVGDLKTESAVVTLVHADMARKFGDNASDVARAVDILGAARSMHRPR